MTSWYVAVAQPRRAPVGLAGHLRFALGTLALLFVLNVYAPANPTIAERALASIAIALAALPAWLWIAGVDRALPFMPFFGLVFTAYFTAPIFILHDFVTLWSIAPMPSRLITRALEYILLGLVCVMAGYYGPQSILVNRVTPRMTMRWRRPGFLKLSGIAFGVAGIAIFMSQRGSSDNLHMVLAFGADSCVIGLCILFALQLYGRLDRFTAIFLWCVLVPVRFWIGLATGLTSEGLIVLLTLMFVYSTVRRRIPWIPILLGGVLFFVLRPVENGFRMVAWRGVSQDKSQTEKIAMLYQMTRDSIIPMIEGRGTAFDNAYEISSRRLGTDVLTFAAVLGDTPGIIPFWGGASYYPMLFKFVPRFIYPDKPQEVSGQSFGHRYGLLDPSNFETSYNLPQLLECYINFGVPGIIIGMFIFGMIYRAVQCMFVHPDMGFGALVLGCYISIELLQIESAASIVLGATIWALVYVGLLNLFIQSGEMDHVSGRVQTEPL